MPDGGHPLDENQFIAALRSLPLHSAARDLQDDAAILQIGDQTLVITHDAMVEGRHFLATQDPADIAWKLVATNLSDLAAKGADPIGLILGYTLGEDDARFIEGLDDALLHYNVPLLGGDTVSTDGSRTLGLTAIGRATYSPVPSRSGARVGDAVFVTGVLGAAMLGFEALTNSGDGDADTTAYTRPMARVIEGQDLAPLANAMMDVSDGLLLDAYRMAEASGVSIAIAANKVPVISEQRRHDCMTWGDDYELLFTLPDNTLPPVPATHIGFVEAKGFAPLFLDGEPIVNSEGLGYRHE